MNRAERFNFKVKGDRIATFLIAFLSAYVSIDNFVTYFSTSNRDVENLISGIFALFVVAIMALLGSFLIEVKKTGKPFSKKSKRELNAIAILTLVSSAGPDYIGQILHGTIFTDANYINLPVSEIFTDKAILLLLLGGVIGIISEVFSFGTDLQNDMDTIA